MRVRFGLLIVVAISVLVTSYAIAQDAPNSNNDKASSISADEKNKVESAYKAALKTNKCEKKYWSRYEFGEYFTSFAKRGKITPYDVVNGSEYERRHLKLYSWDEFLNNYVKYVGNLMPDTMKQKFEQEFNSEEAKVKNQKAVFNLSIQRDYDCYKKLK